MAATRYGVVFDHVLEHLWSARTYRDGPIDLAAVLHVEDLVVAIACARRCGTAWADLNDHFEPILSRRCVPRLGETRALLLVRRLLTDLRTSRCVDGGLRAYVGEVPLRSWLTDRVLSEASRLPRASKPSHAEVRTPKGASLRRSDAASPTNRWWEHADVPSCLPLRSPRETRRQKLPPPAAGASE